MDKSDPVTDQGDIWIYDVARKLGDRVTSSPLNETAPVWSSDDSRLYWMSAVGASRTGDVHAQTLGRASREEKIFASAGQSRPSEVTPDGRTLLVVTRGVDIGSSRKLVMLSLADGKVTPWTTSGFSEGTGRVTRDGHWIAFTSDETGETEVYVQRFPEGGEKWRVSTAGGTSPVWRGDGRELYYVVKDRQMMSVSFRAEPTVEIGAPVLLFQAPLEPNFSQAQYDVSADGRRFLLDRLVQVKGRSAMVLDQGWTPPR
jgi:Tol biopolymer transport system component